jgi:hypothetical protein
MADHTRVMPPDRASASEPGGDGVRGRSPRQHNGMTAGSCVIRWGGGLDG